MGDYELLEANIMNQIENIRNICEKMINSLSEQKVDCEDAKNVLSNAKEALLNAYNTRIIVAKMMNAPSDYIKNIEERKDYELRSLDEVVYSILDNLENKSL